MQYYYLIVTLARAAKQYSSFTYHSEADLPIGQIVQVEVGKKVVPGVILAATKKPSFTTKAVTRVLDLPPLPLPLLETASWMRDFYHSHEVNIWQTILPGGIGKNRRTLKKVAIAPQRDRTTIVLNSEQAAAVAQIEQSPAGTILLQGITGSGKTQIYIETAKLQLQRNRSTIVLVPEIALTSQLIAEFSQHFTNIIVTHSTMTEARRYDAWLRCLEATTPVIVIGPRSALFSPLHNLGLIIIDECHEPSFKQESMPRYSALRTASVLARLHEAKLILGSATPSIADRFLAENSSRPIVQLKTLARTTAVAPSIEIIDMKKPEHFTKHRFLSNALLSAVQAGLDNGQQSLVFHNRRGSAPTTLCKECGWLALCPNCFLPLTLHNDSFSLLCHVCNFSQSVPTSCPVCGAAEVIHKGIGTKAIEEALRRLFPKASIYRFDADADSDATVDKLYQELYDGKIDIIIGTQVIAKGLDLPKLTTVGIVQADSGLALPDFQSGERVFQLISQVRGRIGRSQLPSKLIVQSYQPENKSVTAGIAQDYEGFYATTLAERRQQLFPPFRHLLKITCSYKTETAAIRAARDLATLLRTTNLDIQVFGPAPAFYERTRDAYRWQLIVKSADRTQLVAAVKLIPAAHWQFELDPTTLL